tara:strand:+ start:401 stop:1291 length:891 start_codon:yes stop_codon:yes gene_type:complete
MDHRNGQLKNEINILKNDNIKLENIIKSVKNYESNLKNDKTEKKSISKLFIRKAINFYNINKKLEKSIIPLNVYQTYKTLDLPKSMKEAHDILKKQNPEFKFHLYDDTMCRNFIKKHFNKDVLFAFDNLIPGAYKADLWRYCILFINGGIYIDIKFIIDQDSKTKFIDLISEEYLVIDSILNDKYEYIYQGFIVSKPNNKILKKCIDEIVFNVINKCYKDCCLSVTGPGLFGRIIYENIYLFNFNIEFLENQGTDQINSYISYKKEKFLVKHQVIEYYKNLHDSYLELWNSKKIFK